MKWTSSCSVEDCSSGVGDAHCPIMCCHQKCSRQWWHRELLEGYGIDVVPVARDTIGPGIGILVHFIVLRGFERRRSRPAPCPSFPKLFRWPLLQRDSLRNCGCCRGLWPRCGCPTHGHTGGGQGRKIFHTRVPPNKFPIGSMGPNHKFIRSGNQRCFSCDETVGGEQVVPPHCGCVTGGASVRGGIIFEECTVGDVHLGQRAEGLDVLLHGVVRRVVGDLDVITIDEVLGDLPACRCRARFWVGVVRLVLGRGIGEGAVAAVVLVVISTLRMGASYLTGAVEVDSHLGEARHVQLEAWVQFAFARKFWPGPTCWFPSG